MQCVKSVQIQSFFWSVFCYIWAEYGPQKCSVFGNFSRSDVRTVELNTIFAIIFINT